MYETHLTIPQPILEKMLRPSINKDYQGKTAYYNRVQIGLAPEGKVAVWLSGVSRGEPNYRVTPSVLYTLSGDKLSICKGITRISTGYEFGENTKDFIKGKVYPYGNW
ncbi:putative lipoprotein [Erwinia amylovora Ea644]|nr:putative lipoprotein [Erwinia amylovora Ea644]